MEESPLWDENNEEFNYYDDVDRDTEMASSQETTPVSSQETVPASSQETPPMSSQESRGTAPVSSQESMSQGTMSISSQESTTGTTILDAEGGTPMEDEACLDDPTMKCSPEEERELLNPLLTEPFDHLEDMPLGYLDVLVARINEVRRFKACRIPVSSPRVPPGLPPLLPTSTPLQPVPTPAATGIPGSLSKAIYSAASNLGTSVPHHGSQMPTRLPDQAKTDQAIRILEEINKAPGTMPAHSEPWSEP